jgi:hypothetical protein
LLVIPVSTLFTEEANAKTVPRVITAPLLNFSLFSVNPDRNNLLPSKQLAFLVEVENGLYSVNGSAISALKAISAPLLPPLLSSVLTVPSQLREPLLALPVPLHFSKSRVDPLWTTTLSTNVPPALSASTVVSELMA